MPNEFTYSSQPHSAPLKSAKYREDSGESDHVPLTLMSDPRVVRGNTNSLARKITKAKTEMSKSLNLARVPKQPDTVPRPTYTYDVKAFSNQEIDINAFLVQQDDLPKQTKEIESQTNEFLERPATPPYIPRKTGMDRSTQVEDVRELFNFDIEVIPLLEVIVKKTLEQSLFEVQSEEELLALENAANKFHAEKAREDAWVASQEQAAKREEAESLQRIKVIKEKKSKETQTKNAIAGLQMMKQLLPSVVESIYNRNLKTGVWDDPDRTFIMQEIIPELIHDVTNRRAAYVAARTVLDDLISSSQDLYLTYPRYRAPTVGKAPTISITFQAASNENDATEEDGEGSTAVKAKKANNDPTLTFDILHTDSVQSLEKKIRSEIARIKAPPPVDEENPTAEVKVNELAAKLPDPNVPLNLRIHFSRCINEIMGPPSRDIAMDAVLRNFPIPLKSNVIISMS